MGRTALSKAWEIQDWEAVLDEVEHSLSKKTGGGCWECVKVPGPLGYVQLWTGKRAHYCHRVTMAARLGREISSAEVVHHICGNRKCCNPEHLQIVTQAENLAEMFERNSYLVRIEQLETALREVNPDHELLVA